MKYDWSDPNIPSWVKWIAMNEDSTVQGFCSKPLLNTCLLGWESTNENHNPMKLSLPPLEGDWEESLEERLDA